MKDLVLTHVSPEPINRLYDVEQMVLRHQNHVKPHGLWLAVGNLWVRSLLRGTPADRKLFTGRAGMSKFCMYRATLRTDSMCIVAAELPPLADCQAGKHRDQLLVLVGFDAVLAFHTRYRHEERMHDRANERIDWSRIAKHFAGLMVCYCNYIHSYPRWYYEWEFDSACVWRPVAAGIALHQLPESQVKKLVKQTKDREKATWKSR